MVIGRDAYSGGHASYIHLFNCNTQYIYDETKVVEISKQHFSTCQQANGQFCSTNTPLQPLINPQSGVTAIYAKNKSAIEKGGSLQIRKTNSATIPIPIAPNVWTLSSAHTAVMTELTIICPD